MRITLISSLIYGKPKQELSSFTTLPTEPYIMSSLQNTKPTNTKVDVPNSVTHFGWTPIFVWCVVRRDLKNWHQKDMCWKEIGLRVQNILAIPGSIVNKIGEGRSLWPLKEQEKRQVDNE